MTQPETRSIRRPTTAEERDKFQKYHEQVEEDIPELCRQAREAEAAMRAAAMREPSVTGQLRRAIAESGMLRKHAHYPAAIWNINTLFVQWNYLVH